jgi:hypothetical protein
MSTLQNSNFGEEPEFRADLGEYREIKVKGMVDEVHGVRIDSGEVWDIDHFIPHTLSLDGFVLVRKKSIMAELNADRYDKVNFLYSLGDMPEWPAVFPTLDSDRELFEYLRDARKLVMLFLAGRSRSVIALVERVGGETCGIRLLSDELVLADDLVGHAYATIRVVVMETELLKMFDRYIAATEQA